MAGLNCLALDRPAIKEEHLFIPLDRTKEAIDNLFDETASAAIIRATFAAGKSKLINHTPRRHESLILTTIPGSTKRSRSAEYFVGCSRIVFA
jgi:hypothetical protein